MTDIRISSEPLSIDQAYASVVDPACGGICLFVGAVRNLNKGETVTHLEFDTYDGMAIKELQVIADHCIANMDVSKVAIYHRKGVVDITGIAVIIALSTVHRAASFTACEYVIDRLKETVPIWKKEYLMDGSYWVGSRP